MKVFFLGVEESHVNALGPALSKGGFEVVSSQDPVKGDALLQSETSPIITILDWDLIGPRMAGQLMHLIASRRHELPMYVMLVSSVNGNMKYLEALDLGADDCLPKPLDPEVLSRKLAVASSFLRDKQSLIESASVLERYSQHIDNVAHERAQQLFHAERLSTLGTMSTGIAHEISTPLSYISTSLETVRAYWNNIEGYLKAAATGQAPAEPPPDLEKMLTRLPKALERIDYGISKVVGITNGLKFFGKSSQTERKKCSVNSCVKEAIEICDGTIDDSLQIITELDPNLPESSINPQQIEQVIINLIVNASHALEGRQDTKVWITTSANDSRVTVVIEDNGPGIPEEICERIWDAFFTTKEVGKGTGLGLAISKGIIRDHSGTIKVGRGEKGGARFEFHLPRTAAS